MSFTSPVLPFWFHRMLLIFSHVHPLVSGLLSVQSAFVSLSYAVMCTLFNFKLHLLYPTDQSYMVLKVQAVAYI